MEATLFQCNDLIFKNLFTVLIEFKKIHVKDLKRFTFKAEFIEDCKNI